MPADKKNGGNYKWNAKSETFYRTIVSSLSGNYFLKKIKERVFYRIKDMW